MEQIKTSSCFYFNIEPDIFSDIKTMPLSLVIGP